MSINGVFEVVENGKVVGYEYVSFNPPLRRPVYSYPVYVSNENHSSNREERLFDDE